MPLYEVGVARIYHVTIEAENPKDAENFASSFLETKDGSWEVEREEGHFKINEIEIIESDAFLID